MDSINVRTILATNAVTRDDATFIEARRTVRVDTPRSGQVEGAAKASARTGECWRIKEKRKAI
jgi:hypothetical protein